MTAPAATRTAALFREAFPWSPGTFGVAVDSREQRPWSYPTHAADYAERLLRRWYEHNVTRRGRA